MPFSTFTGNQIIDHMFRNQAYTTPSAIYVSLHTGDPGLIGSNEVTGGSYARQVVNFSAASNKATSNSAIINFVYMPSGSISYAGLWAAGAGGSFLISGSLSAPKYCSSSDTFSFPVTNLSINVT